MMVLLPCFQTNVWAGGEPEEIPIKGDPSPRPRARARSFNYEASPVCYYCDGEVSIQADSSITFINATVERLEDNAVWTDASMGDSLIMSVTDEPGTYILTFTLSNGKSYIGEYTLY